MNQTLRRLCCLLLICAALPVARAQAEGVEPTIIVDRRSDGVSLYFALPAPRLEGVFGADISALLTETGTADRVKLLEGTYEVAEDLIASLGITGDGEPAPFQATSLMLHHPEALPPFETPLDAEISVSVCTSADTIGDVAQSLLQAYMGYFAWKLPKTSVIEIDFPERGNGPMVWQVLDYRDFALTGRSVVEVADGGTLRLAPMQYVRGGLAKAALLVGLCCLALLAAIALWRRSGGLSRSS
ncbi:hypothetical protein [Algicella marina]|uniref:Uncharacterized protein n=1 Tax=Algicella marina TaxID=2683284 RepID=A0A6P1T036_9RHOB|nr:hypothetical protein [Algicella marina]QHQ33852.1 hypothetical protein GO499_00985 [Algicella marina]